MQLFLRKDHINIFCLILKEISINFPFRKILTIMPINRKALLRYKVLGYYAPIIVVDRKYYRYEDEDYSITKVPLSQSDLLRLSEAVDLLKQMSSFKGFDGVE